MADHKNHSLRLLAMQALWRKFNRLDPAVKLAATIGCHVNELPDLTGEWTQEDLNAARECAEEVRRNTEHVPDHKAMLDHWARHGVPDHWRATFQRAGLLHT